VLTHDDYPERPGPGLDREAVPGERCRAKTSVERTAVTTAYACGVARSIIAAQSAPRGNVP
jgi:hypothetical protein